MDRMSKNRAYVGLMGSSGKGQEEITCIFKIVHNIAIMFNVYTNYTTLKVIVSVIAGVLSTDSCHGDIGSFSGDLGIIVEFVAFVEGYGVPS